jgi:predicted DNA-binding antitoxin AbrB/MazE fold protein
MDAINAHFDGHVFVPDEPVSFRPGEKVLIQPAGEFPVEASRGVDVSFLRKLDIDLDARSLREIIQDPELRLENL